MKTFTYPLLARIIFRYANIPLTIVFFMYLVISVMASKINLLYLIPAIINAVLIYIINRFYFTSYKIFPYKIEVDDDKMVCSDFPFSNKIIHIKFEDIERITGSIFSSIRNKPVEIYDGRQKITIAFSLHLRKINELLTIILSNIRKEKSDELLARLHQNNINRRQGK